MDEALCLFVVSCRIQPMQIGACIKGKAYRNTLIGAERTYKLNEEEGLRIAQEKTRLTQQRQTAGKYQPFRFAHGE